MEQEIKQAEERVMILTSSGKKEVCASAWLPFFIAIFVDAWENI